MRDTDTDACYTIDEFCRAHRLSKSSYYDLKRRGLGPREIRVMRKPLVTVEAAAEWRQRMTEQDA